MVQTPGRRRLLVLAVLALVMVSFAAVPATAGSDGPSISTGEVHAYNDPDPHAFCPMVLTTWRVELHLQEPGDDDAVGLTVEGSDVPPAGAGVATGDDPSAVVVVRTKTGCAPPVQVTGIVAEDTRYSLSLSRY